VTDEEIALYAELRVAVHPEWEIRLAGDRVRLVVRMKRPVIAEPGSYAPGAARFFRLPNHSVVGWEEVRVAAPRIHAMIEQARRQIVLRALEEIEQADYALG